MKLWYICDFVVDVVN